MAEGSAAFHTFIRRSVAMFYAAVVLPGAVSLSHLRVDLLPDVAVPAVTVRTTLPDVAPRGV